MVSLREVFEVLPWRVSLLAGGLVWLGCYALHLLRVGVGP